MAQIDQLLHALVQRSADALLFVADERAQLQFGSETKPLVNQTLSAPQIKKLLGELVSPQDLQRIGAGSLEFRYELNGVGTFAGKASESGGLLVVVVKQERPSPEEPAPADPGPPPSAPAPPAPAANGDPIAPFPAPALPAPVPPVPRPGPIPAGELADRFEIDRLFRIMVARGSSDLHLCVGVPPMVRVDGTMLKLPGEKALTREDTERLLFPIVPARNKQQFDDTNDSDFAYELVGLARFRCNVFRDRMGVAGVFRQIPARIMTPEELGLSKQIQNLCFLSKGLVLITGPTGSGKTTTLATLIDLVNSKREDHIITIEDPIEFVHPNKKCLVNQREVGVHTSSFKQALRAALREDPDVVLVGEMRDLETIAIAIETAVTGHLVFGTLHTSTAVQTVDRIIDQFPADRQSQVRVMLADCLKGVISQTLLRRKGGGRIAALEILLGTQSTSNLIREGKTYQLPSVMQTSRNLGMTTLNDMLLDYVKRGLLDPQEAYVKCVDKEALMGAFKKAEIKLELA